MRIDKETTLLVLIAQSRKERYLSMFDVPRRLYFIDFGWHNLTVESVRMKSYPKTTVFKEVVPRYSRGRRNTQSVITNDYHQININILKWLSTFDFQKRNLNEVECQGVETKTNMYTIMPLTNLYIKDRFSKKFV